MRYFLIAGEPSGDLHASNLMRALKERDPEAQFRYYGGDKMSAVGGELMCHYKDIAYMGFIPVLTHARTILSAMKRCRESVLQWSPDVLILIDYPGFNLSIAKYVKLHSRIPVFYYISPKIWAWKEYRIKDIRAYVDQLYSILPFEIPFFEQKHHYHINYVGNPSVDEIAAWRGKYDSTFDEFLAARQLPHKPIIALLPGSRKQEIKDNLKRMVRAAMPYTERGYQLLIAGTQDISDEFYHRYISEFSGGNVADMHLLRNDTFEILAHAEAGLITSGTATLETALFHTPQVVCYYISMGKLVSLLRRLFLKVKYISLVNLIVGREVVPELVADQMNVKNLSRHLDGIVKGGSERQSQLEGYEEMTRLLGEPGAPQRAAEMMIGELRKKGR